MNLVAAANSAQMDIVIRITALESAAKARPGSWPRDRRGLALAANFFGSDIDPDWLSERNTYIYDSMLSKARRGVSHEVAEEVVQGVIGGLSLSGGAIQAVAGKLAEHIKNGGGVDKLKALLVRHVWHRTLDEVRRKRVDQGEDGKTLVRVGPGQTDEESMIEAPSNTMFNQRTENDFLIGLLQTPQGAWIRDLLKDIWSTKGSPSERAIALQHLEDPSRPLQDLAAEIGVSPSYVTRSIKRMIEVAKSEIANNRQVQRFIDRNRALNDLGYGGTITASAARVAARHLFASVLTAWGREINRIAKLLAE